MEKRWCERIPVSINVVLVHQGNKIGKCRVKDISLRGICLSSGPLDFRKNTEVTISFPDTGKLYSNTNEINAIVVRNSREEICLMFDPPIPEMISPIINQAKKYTDFRPTSEMCFATD